MIVYKGFIIKASPASPQLLTVATEGKGGKIPDIMRGLFTSYGLVKAIIDQYVDKKKGKVNASQADPEGGA